MEIDGIGLSLILKLSNRNCKPLVPWRFLPLMERDDSTDIDDAEF